MWRWRLLVSLLVLAAWGGAWAQWASFVQVFHRAQAGIAPGTVAHVRGYTVLTLHVAASGSPSFEVQFQGSVDGSAFVLTHCQALLAPRGESHTVTATGVWRCNVAGLSYFRAHISTFTGPGHSLTIQGTVLALPGML